MPERLVRPLVKRRRPVGWNQLLRKGHVHAARKSGRSDDRRALDSEVEEALAAREAPAADDPVPPQSSR